MAFRPTYNGSDWGRDRPDPGGILPAEVPAERDDPEGACNRAYCAMFDAARAGLLSLGADARMQAFSIDDLHMRPDALTAAAQAGQLALVTSQGQPLFVSVPFDEILLREGSD